jgi:hypothetical protein
MTAPHRNVITGDSAHIRKVCCHVSIVCLLPCKTDFLQSQYELLLSVGIISETSM